MIQSRKNLLHGCRVPRTVILSVLSVEYIILFYSSLQRLEGILLFIGYFLLTVAITCNNHGRNVQVKYEQELSLILKCVAANLILSVFMCAVYVDNCIPYMIRLGILLILQLLSIVIMCEIVMRITIENYKGKRLYLYQEKTIDISSIPQAESMSVDKVSMEIIKQKIKEYDEVYLFDLSAEKRNDLLKICFKTNRPVYFTTKLSDMELRAAGLAQDGETPIFYRQAGRIGGISAALKRLFDILFSGVLLVILAPLFGIIALCIKLDDGENVFYYQTRCTRGMKKFQIIKFRSMVVGAEKFAGAQLAQNRDPRMTRVGYILRKYKLDEVPQLINIFRGEMSFVGPRPERPELIEEIAEKVPEFTFRTTVRAGLTGYAQVHGDYHTEFLDKLKKALVNDLSGSVIQENVNYYNDYITEEVRKGRRESDVIEELGDPWAIAKNIITSEEMKGNTQESYDSYEPGRRRENSYEQDYGSESGYRGTHVFGLDTWWKKLVLILGIIGIVVLVVAVVGGIISLLAPIFVPLLIVCLIIKLINGRRR